MFTFDEAKFFESYTKSYSALKPEQATGLGKLLALIGLDPDVQDVRWAAYMFATIKHECAETWHPIEEFGKGKNRDYGVPVTVHGPDGKEYVNVYYGRGYVQLTWKDNYERLGKLLSLDDLLIDPAIAVQPEPAYRIMSFGMRNGSFTGKKLGDFIHENVCDYQNARRIINGLDQCQKIRRYAETLESVLRASIVS